MPESRERWQTRLRRVIWTPRSELGPRSALSWLRRGYIAGAALVIVGVMSAVSSSTGGGAAFGAFVAALGVFTLWFTREV